MNIYFKKKQIVSILIFGVMAIIGTLTLANEYRGIKADVLKSYKSQNEEDSFFDKIEKTKINNKNVEDAVNKNIFGRNIFVETYGSVQKLMLKKEGRNFEYVKDNDGYVHSGAFYIEHDKELFGYSKRIRKMKEAAANSGAKLLFVSYPEKSWITTNQEKGLPIREYDYIQDEFLTYLMNNRVDSLDLRVSLKKMNADKNRLYYKTDKTMTTYGSFMVFQSIISELNSRYGESLDPEGIYSDINNYSVENYTDSFLGYVSRKIGKSFSGVDDFEIYVPKFKGQYTWELTNDQDEIFFKTGDINILLERIYMNEKNLYKRSPLKVFMRENNKLDKVVNMGNPEGPKILWFKDDNFSPVAVFMAPVCSELHLINLSTTDVDIEEYVKENKFDYVLFGISAGHINGDYFKFFKKES